MPNNQESQAEIDANQVPKIRGGGPQSAAGKRSSSRNSWKHGYASESLEVPDSERAAYEASRAQFFAETAPQGPLQSTLVDRMCRNSWKLTRIAEEEDELISLQRLVKHAVTVALDNNDQSRADDLAEFQANIDQQAKLLARYEQAAERGFHKAFNTFLRLRRQPDLLTTVALEPPAPPQPSYAPRRQAPANVQPRTLPAAPNEPRLSHFEALLTSVEPCLNVTATPPIGRR